MIAQPKRSAAGAWVLGIAGWFIGALVIGVGVGRSLDKSVSTGTPEPVASLKISPDPHTGQNLNVLLVTIDTLRPDRLGCYGYKAGRTPTLDSLAADGIRFEHAFSQVPLTLPSHASIMTGRSPALHGLHVNGASSLSAADETLGEVLQSAGYRTAAFVSAIVLHRRYGLDQGFSVYEDEVNRLDTPSNVHVSERPANEVTDAALRWFSEPAGPANYFAWVHYYDPHAEYTPPKFYQDLLPGRPYDGEIAFVDAELNRLLEGLRLRGALDNTLIVIASDHGESLGDHGEETHAILVYDSTLHVVLMVSHPDARRANADGSPWHGRVLPDLVRLVDVAPTILDLVGAPVPDLSEGRSLVPTILESAGGDPYAYGESYQSFVDYGWARLLSVRDGRWKFIHGAREELYDVREDPRETTNLAAEEPDEVRRLRKELERYLRDAAENATPAEAVAMDPETLQRLQALGYVGSSGPAPTDEPVNIEEDLTRPDPSDLIDEHLNLIFGAVSELNEGNVREARTKLLRMLAIDPKNKSVMNFLAQCEYELGNLPASRDYLERVIQIDPNWHTPLQALSTVLFEMGEKEAAIDFMRQALALNPVDPNAHELLGTYLRNQGDLEGAIAEYETAVEQDPGSTSALFNLGLAYESTDRPELATHSLRRAIESNPDHLGAIENLANLYGRFGPCSWSIPLYHRALELAPEPMRAALYANLGNALALLAEHEKARAAYEESIRRNPKNAQTHYALGVSLAFLGDIPGARREWEKALEIDPTHQAARANLKAVKTPPGRPGA